MALCRGVPFLRGKIKNVAECCIRRSHFRRSVLPMNTYHRFKGKAPKCGIQPQQFKYFLVLDFEASCDERDFPEMEIIEFPCLKVESKNFQVVDQFHSYVRPIRHPELTPFCINLTGICQTMVDNKPPFTDVLDSFLDWVKKGDIVLEGLSRNSIFITSGDWDFLTMLPNQCALSGISVPTMMKSWINIKKSFLRSTGVYPHGINDMLSLLKLQHEGRLHSGIDDCKNIYKIVRGLAERGFVFEVTRSL